MRTLIVQQLNGPVGVAHKQKRLAAYPRREKSPGDLI
jgi:hypothetical protein